MEEAGELATSTLMVEKKEEDQSGSEPIKQAIANNLSKEKLPLEVEPTQVNSLSAKADNSEELVVNSEKGQLSRFHRDLDNALHWIENQDQKKATIQVMTISSRNFDASAYYSYLETLVAKNIDVSKFRVYQTSIDDSIVFGVIYDVYANLREARQDIQQLPETLKARAPVPRTFGGIWNEINDR